MNSQKALKSNISSPPRVALDRFLFPLEDRARGMIGGLDEKGSGYRRGPE